MKEIQMLLEGPHVTTLDKRDAAILELLYSSGLRLSELSQLNVKRGLRVRRKFAKAGETALFVNRWGVRLGNRGILFRLDQWAQEQNLGRKFHPHLLRHSFATHMLQSSGDLRAVQELLGHKQISNTEIYIPLDMSDISKEYRKAHPKAKRHSGKSFISSRNPRFPLIPDR